MWISISLHAPLTPSRTIIKAGTVPTAVEHLSLPNIHGSRSKHPPPQINSIHEATRSYSLPNSPIPTSKISSPSTQFHPRRVRCTMKLYLQVVFVIMTAFIHMAPVLGLNCPSGCGACWKDGSSGVDTKFRCTNNECGTICPSGYKDMHCATYNRCK